MAHTAAQCFLINSCKINHECNKKTKQAVILIYKAIWESSFPIGRNSHGKGVMARGMGGKLDKEGLVFCIGIQWNFFFLSCFVMRGNYLQLIVMDGEMLRLTFVDCFS